MDRHYISASRLRKLFSPKRLKWPTHSCTQMITEFEVCGHPAYSLSRSGSALQLLDNILRILQLTCIDVENPSAPVFAKNTVPALSRNRPSVALLRSSISNTHTNNPPSFPTHQFDFNIPGAPLYPGSHTTATTKKPLTNGQSKEISTPRVQNCPCQSLALINCPEAHQATPLWLMSPKWNPDWTYAEIRQEESRRLIWSTLGLASGSILAKLAGKLPLPDLYVTRPENVSPFSFFLVKVV